MAEEIKIKMKKNNLIALLIALVALSALIIFSLYSFKPDVSVQEQDSRDLSGLSLEAKFAALSNAKTNFCAGPDIVDRVDAQSLQGSCCSKMDLHRYEEQVEGLASLKEELKGEYPSLDEDLRLIPDDPYDISRELAEELLKYQKEIQLTAAQQAVYDEATDMSMEGGPCCCKCWRWYAFEGQAKYLITEYDFTAEQIAEIWDIEDGCGGSGHIHHGPEVERTIFEPGL